MAPRLPDDVDTDVAALDRGLQRELAGLPAGLAELIGKHLVAAFALLEDDVPAALEHARFVRSRAARVPAVREAAGVVAYQAEEWAEALSELRTARRLGGGPGLLAVMADCERALGRPERALDLARSPEARQLDAEEAAELRIVAAGARRDLGQADAAVVGLQGPDLDDRRRDPWSARLFYAYADNLEAVGRTDEAVRWFIAAADADDDGETDAGERAAALSGDGVAALPTADDVTAAAASPSGSDGVAGEDMADSDAATSDASGDEIAHVPDSVGVRGASPTAGEVVADTVRSGFMPAFLEPHGADGPDDENSSDSADADADSAYSPGPADDEDRRS